MAPLDYIEYQYEENSVDELPAVSHGRPELVGYLRVADDR